MTMSRRLRETESMRTRVIFEPSLKRATFVWMTAAPKEARFGLFQMATPPLWLRGFAVWV